MKKNSIKSRCVFLILLLAVLATQGAIAQAAGEEEVIGYRKTVSVGAGIGNAVPRKAARTSAMGRGSMYSHNPKWEVGV